MPIVKGGNLDNIGQQIAALKAQEERYDAAYQNFLKGRDLATAEREAQRKIDDASNQAAAILASAQETQDLAREAMDRARQDAIASNAAVVDVERLRGEVAQRIKDAEDREEELKGQRSNVDRIVSESNDIKNEYLQKLADLKSTVASFADGI